MKEICNFSEIRIKKVKILKDKKYKTRRRNTRDQPIFSHLSGIFIHINARKIIYQYSYEQYQDIYGDKEHVKDTTCQEQMNPPIFMR